MSKEKSLKELLAEFEKVVEWFESEDLTIEEASEKFKEASDLAEVIKKKLETSKNQIEIIKQGK